ncbi:4-coumarate-CoA ligase 2 [Purpureocillium lilacinum]|uniref:4-coumarate-CoA ligase 2 n=1 Tax=Purpureocillium lilacinum TaxID=33203 RepID=A0A179GF67_PURLI|nr:4-coumarate-CoA ligase 2 [Purpureocillium lilacinum]
MLPFRIAAPWACILTSSIHSAPFTRATRAHLPRLRLLLQQRQPQRRCLASQPPPSAGTTAGKASGPELQKQARAAAQNPKQYEIPERLIIYHAGTGRTTFLAMLKLTSLFVGAFFCLVAVPGYVKADKPWGETAGVALCGILPFAFVAYTTAPFVTHIHVHLPPAARPSRATLARFVAAMPASTRLTLTTMSAIAKPRYSDVRVGDLLRPGVSRPSFASPSPPPPPSSSSATAARTQQQQQQQQQHSTTRRRTPSTRFGIVNYVRDAAEENAARKWYELRAVDAFYVQESTTAANGGGSGSAASAAGPRRKPGAAASGRRGRAVVETWIWDAVRDKIAKRAAKEV